MTPEKATSPEVKSILYDPHLLIEWLRNHGDLHVHIYKPVEADIRRQEDRVRQMCESLYTPSDDPREREQQAQAQVLQERCDARRMAWREGGGDARWPDIEEFLDVCVREAGLHKFRHEIEFQHDLDSWGIRFYQADAVPDTRVRKLTDDIAARFAELGTRWPPEIFEGQ